ncbi:hypothetical protein [Limosilactobacillus rudii]|uniref:hypothetical protein n=1 Tax=Limosilactobacillus rudii TaxID=2759755 RepID=UPI001E59083B|nr:hypothetical protein [Limosilactobacillus rudii]MCD7134311.1 hypothetical protein [Limosilactobacillus rudii]
MRNQADNKDRFIAQIQNEIDKVKSDPERRQGFMKYEMLMMDAKRKAREEGKTEGKSEARKEGIRTLVKNLQELGVDKENIKKRVKASYNLTSAEVEKYLTNLNS